jgi:hypothetical protein
MHAAADDVRIPAEAQLLQAAAIISKGKKICILAGRGPLNAGTELSAAIHGVKVQQIECIKDEIGPQTVFALG